MSERFLTSDGLLAVGASRECSASVGDYVRVVKIIGITETVRLGKLGKLHGYTAGQGYAIVSYEGDKLPVLVHASCLEVDGNGKRTESKHE